MVLRSKTACYTNSFIPSTVKLWNSLPADIVGCSNFSPFKIKLKSFLNLKTVSDVSFYYTCLHSGKIGTALTNIWLGVGPLNDQLFVINAKELPFCPHCVSLRETSTHYFLFCSKYSAERKILFDIIRKIIPGLRATCVVNDIVQELNIAESLQAPGLTLRDKQFSKLLSFIVGFEIPMLVNGSNAAFLDLKPAIETLYRGVVDYVYNSRRLTAYPPNFLILL